MPAIDITSEDRLIAARVRAARRAAGLTQVTVANAVGVAYQQLQKYENGTNRIAASTLVRLADALGQPVTALLPDPPGTAAGAEAAGAIPLDASLQALAAGWDLLTDKQQREVTDLVLALGQKNRAIRRGRREA